MMITEREMFTMTNLSQEILADWQVRKSKKQKSAFIEFIQSRIPEAKVEEKGSVRNIVIGDVDSAKVVYTAHYDTCAVMPLPNFITPKNILIYIVYQLILVGIMFAVAALCGWAVSALGGEFLLSYWTGLIVLWVLIMLIMVGPANRHTANDNTSGVITVLETYFAMSPELREKCAFVLFDQEELGLVGSSAFFKLHKKSMKGRPLVNFDCVSDGDHMLFVVKKKAHAALADTLSNAFVPVGEKKVMIEKSSSAFYPSDQQHFPLGVGVAALNKSHILGYYMNRIHTTRDTVFDERNIELLRDGAVRLAEII